MTRQSAQIAMLIALGTCAIGVMAMGFFPSSEDAERAAIEDATFVFVQHMRTEGFHNIEIQQVSASVCGEPAVAYAATFTAIHTQDQHAIGGVLCLGR